MPKSKQQKTAMVTELAEKLKASQGVFVIAPKSVNPNEAAELKMQLDAIGGEYHVVKNSLFKLAAEQVGLEFSADFANGQNAIVLVGDRSPEAAKIMDEFIKDTEKAEFKGGYLESKQISAADVKSLAALPSREQLLAQVLATMNAPVSGFVRVLAGNIQGVVNVIDAYKRSKE
jgi:large subunit ribosomal protein L10